MNKYQAGLNTNHLEKAVIIVYDQIEKSGQKPASEHWTMYAHPKAKQMVSRVKAEYKRITDVRCVIEPHVIADTYLHFRKLSRTGKQKMRDDCQLDVALIEVG